MYVVIDMILRVVTVLIVLVDLFVRIYDRYNKN